MGMLAWPELIPAWSFRDGRLRERTLVLLDAMLRKPGVAFTELFGKALSHVKQAYDFCENPRVSMHSILSPSFLTTGQRLREEGGTTLILQDTTEFDQSHNLAMTGLGELGNPKCKGLFLHGALAVAPDGLPLGLVSALTWIREPAAHGKAADRKGRAFEDKESFKWWTTILNAERVAQAPGKLVHIGDREIDVFDVSARCDAAGYRFLFRAAQDRRVLNAEHERLWAEVQSWREHGRRLIHIPARPAHDGHPARVERDAELALRFGTVQLAQPGSRKGYLTVWAILVREVDPPSEQDCVEWLLLTNDPIQAAAEAWLRVEWYRYRWVIEEWHKCMKSTCKIEDRQFQDRTRFEVYLALVMLVAARLLYLQKIARTEPDAPASLILSEEEERVLQATHEEGSHRRRPAALTIRQAVRLIATLGGFLARKGDGEPGFQTLAKGYRELATMIRGYRLASGRSVDLDQVLKDLCQAPPPYPWNRADPEHPH